MNRMRSIGALFPLALIFSLLFTTAVTANFAPPPPGTRYGTVHIKADGSFSPNDLPIMRSGNSYTLLGNITNFGFKIEREDAVLDGAGFALWAKDYFAPRNGVVLEGCSNVTVRNLGIVNFDTGIMLNGSSNNIIKGNSILNSVNGISIIRGSGNNSLSANILQGNIYHGYGIFVSASPGNKFRNNSISSGIRTFYWVSTNKFNFYIEVNKNTSPTDLVQDIDSSNLLDDKPMYYWVGQLDKAVPADASYVALVNCQRITAENLLLENNGQGLLLAGTTDSSIRGCNITGNHAGITLLESTNNTFTDNDIAKNLYGVSYRSSGNTFTQNRFRDNEREHANFQDGYSNIIDLSNTVNEAPLYYGVNQQDKTVPAEAGYVFIVNCSRMIVQNLTIRNQTQGLCFVSATDSLIIGNKILDGKDGICLNNSVNNKVVKNHFTANNGNSVYLTLSNNNIVSENEITQGQVGLYAENCTGNIFSRNTITCRSGVEFLGSTKNQLLENRIEGNDRSGITLSYQSNYNLIVGNNVVDSGFATVNLQNAQNNTFYLNNFRINIEIRNGIYRTHQILDMHANDLVTTPFTTPSHNIWDNGSLGNHWNDYKGTDANNDGIGDAPHTVDTSPHAAPVVVNGKNYTVEATPDVDRYPLPSPFTFPNKEQLTVSEPASTLYKTNEVPLAFHIADPSLQVKYSLDQQAEVEAKANTMLSGLSNGEHSLLLWTIDVSGTPADFRIISFEIYQEPSASPSQAPSPTPSSTQEETKPELQNDDATMFVFAFVAVSVLAAAILVSVFFIKKRAPRRPQVTDA